MVGPSKSKRRLRQRLFIPATGLKLVKLQINILNQVKGHMMRSRSLQTHHETLIVNLIWVRSNELFQSLVRSPAASLPMGRISPCTEMFPPLICLPIQ